MIHITLLCVGTPRSGWVQEGVGQYADRLQHDVQFQIICLPASKEKDPTKQREDESIRLIDALQKREGVVWLLDEQGKAMTSPDFSQCISTAHDEGQSIIFVLGGAFGVTDFVRNAADRTLRLSDMTLPHELCQVLFLEQLYRALQIKKGTGYHH